MTHGGKREVASRGEAKVTIETHMEDIKRKALRFGWQWQFELDYDKGTIYTFQHINTKEFAKVFYIKEAYRKTGEFKRFNQNNPTYLTMPECGLKKIFDKFNCKYIILEDGCEQAYALIEKEYHGKYSKRGKIPYINHIYQGLGILYLLDADLDTKKAFCYHPIIQSGKELPFEDSSVILAKDYSEIANQYLRNSKDYLNITLAKTQLLRNRLVYETEIKNMLIADKIQNYYSFMKNREFIAKGLEAEEIEKYFLWWFDVLDIKHSFLKFCLDYIKNT